MGIKNSWNPAVKMVVLAGILVVGAGICVRARGQSVAQQPRNQNDANQSTDNRDTGPDIGDTPLSVAIVIETSSRVEPLLPSLRRAGILFTQNILGPDGEAALIGYNDEVDHLLDFTGNEDAIEKAVSSIQVGRSGTHLYDALSQGVLVLRGRPSSRRHVIVVVGEDADTGSNEKLDKVIRDAHLSNVTIYSVALSSTAADLRAPQKSGAPPSATPPGIFGMPPVPGEAQTPTSEALRAGNINLGALAWLGAKHATASLRDKPLEHVAAATDGSYQATFRESSIVAAIDRIGGELHPQ